MNPAFPSACRAFLKDLPTHVHTAGSGGAVPHVEGCRSCADRLAAAVLQDRLLRRMPPPAIPPELRSPAFLAAIHERVVEGFEESSLGREVGRALMPMQAPALMPWPEQSLPETVASATGSGDSAPAQLWSQVRSHVLEEIHERRALRRRRFLLASTAAGLLLSVAVLQFLSANYGTSEPPEPVLVRVDSPPAGADFISPGLALQRAAEFR